jgi:hypothetical protein
VPQPARQAGVRVPCIQCRSGDAEQRSPPADFYRRTESDRFAQGTPAVLIRNATIWTGRADGSEVVHGDVLLDRGLVQAVGRVPHSLVESLPGLVEYDVHGAWVTPGSPSPCPVSLAAR